MPGVPFLINCTSGTNQYICFSFYIIIYRFLYQYNNPFGTIDTAIFRSSRPALFCKKGDVTSFAKFTKNTSKKRFPHRSLLVNSAKFLMTSFLKNPSDGCFCINKHSFYLLSYNDFSPFQKKVIHIFWLSIFSA